MRLMPFLLAYGAASLFHHVHNAVFLNEYPNLPAALSPAWILAAWLGMTALGLAGYLLFRRGRRFTGLVLIAVYGAFGFGGLGHYGLAPLSAHTGTMNLTIGLEVATATLLLAAVARLMLRLR